MKNSEQLQNRIIANRHVTKTCHSEGTQCLCNFCGKRINLPCHSEHPPGAWESSWSESIMGYAFIPKSCRLDALSLLHHAEAEYNEAEASHKTLYVIARYAVPWQSIGSNQRGHEILRCAQDDVRRKVVVLC